MNSVAGNLNVSFTLVHSAVTPSDLLQKLKCAHLPQCSLIYSDFKVIAVYRLKGLPVCLLMVPMKPLQHK